MGNPSRLRDDALRIWRAGVDAVDSTRLVRQAMAIEHGCLVVGDERMPLDEIGRIVVVGAGKAGAGMAEAVEAVFKDKETQIAGWVNVPADCVRPLDRIHLHAARPPGINEPTEEGVAGSERILEMAGSLTADDLCLCLLSGGGSALLPAPVEGITLEDKLAVTRHLSGAGANIDQLNTVRKQLSRVKGGGLLRACRAGRLVTLVISDVIGDPLDVIASGPTVENRTTAADALAVLERFAAREVGISDRVFEVLRARADDQRPNAHPSSESRSPPRMTNLVIGNNAKAVAAAGDEAGRLGYSFLLDAATELEGPAEDVGRRLAAMAIRLRDRDGPKCLISGGEPTVHLVDSARRGLGGRNQQLVLAALESLAPGNLDGIALLSGGTDGEDGPTDAAGAVIDAEIWDDAKRTRDQPIAMIRDHLDRNDAYHFFQPIDGLIATGPTHTNVCDLRVVVVV